MAAWHVELPRPSPATRASSGRPAPAASASPTTRRSRARSTAAPACAAPCPCHLDGVPLPTGGGHAQPGRHRGPVGGRRLDRGAGHRVDLPPRDGAARRCCRRAWRRSTASPSGARAGSTNRVATLSITVANYDAGRRRHDAGRRVQHPDPHRAALRPADPRAPSARRRAARCASRSARSTPGSDIELAVKAVDAAGGGSRLRQGPEAAGLRPPPGAPARCRPARRPRGSRSPGGSAC